MNRLSVEEAAGQKGCTAQAIRYAVRKGHIDAERIGKVHAILANPKWEQWQPNPRIQEAVKRRWAQEGGNDGRKPKGKLSGMGRSRSRWCPCSSCSQAGQPACGTGRSLRGSRRSESSDRAVSSRSPSRPGLSRSALSFGSSAAGGWPIARGPRGVP